MVAYTNVKRAFPNGVYTPLVTPFTADEEIDFAAWNKQVLRLAQAGMGHVLLGTNGEAIHLEAAERVALVKAARETLDANGFESTPLLVGTGAGSAKETLKITAAVAEAGADYAIVIHPGYFAFAMASDRTAVKAFFAEVINKSPIPVMIYNFPGAASGIDLTSDEVIELSNLPNCFGVKLTCAGIAKGQRIAKYVQSPEYLAKHGPFQVLPGFTDYLLPALVARQTGVITGTGNVIPKTIVKLYNLSVKALETGDLKTLKEAQDLQDIVADADWTIVKAGIAGTKYALDTLIEPGLGGSVRKPLANSTPAFKTLVDEGLAKAIAIEKSL